MQTISCPPFFLSLSFSFGRCEDRSTDGQTDIWFSCYNRFFCVCSCCLLSFGEKRKEFRGFFSEEPLLIVNFADFVLHAILLSFGHQLHVIFMFCLEFFSFPSFFLLMMLLCSFSHSQIAQFDVVREGNVIRQV
jgi:hypothetical protein